uniref:Uncharacterized protein n=1 Tax=Candidozyma auris TaxID=498019 RepID=A0A0L0P7C0_CANAR
MGNVLVMWWWTTDVDCMCDYACTRWCHCLGKSILRELIEGHSGAIIELNSLFRMIVYNEVITLEIEDVEVDDG